MENRTFLQSNFSKILIPLVVVAGAISLFRYGYAFGQWFYQQVN